MSRRSLVVPMTLVSVSHVQDNLGCLQDTLSGLNVRPYNYLLEQVEVDHHEWYDTSCEPVEVPFCVMTWFPGNFEERDWPEWQEATCHRTRRGAEISLAWFIYHGFAEQDVRIVENHTVSRWELEYHPIED